MMQVNGSENGLTAHLLREDIPSYIYYLLQLVFHFRLRFSSCGCELALRFLSKGWAGIPAATHTRSHSGTIVDAGTAAHSLGSGRQRGGDLSCHRSAGRRAWGSRVCKCSTVSCRRSQNHSPGGKTILLSLSDGSLPAQTCQSSGVLPSASK